MKNFKYIYILITILTIRSILAQQDPNFTLYNFNMNIINPAYAGTGETAQISLVHRSQWLGINDAPNTQVLTYTTPLKNNLGIGISLIKDQVFILQETDATIDVSYNFQLTETHFLSFGLKGGGSFINIDLNKAEAPEEDPLFTDNQSFFNAQMGAGFYLKHPKYYVSISTPNFLNGKRYVKQDIIPRAGIDNLHLYIGGGYHFKFEDNDFSLTPAIMHRRTEGAPSSTDISVIFKYNKVELGTNYRFGETISTFGLFNIIENVRFGLVYDVTISNFAINGSVEMMLRYRF